jgi:hypothetical protein
MRRMGEILGWSPARRRLLGVAIRAIWAIERIWTWRGRVTLRPPGSPSG